MAERPTVVFVLGGPGAGKGTQCAKIVSEFGFVHLSAGDLLRAERTKGGEVGNMISEYIKEGKIIPVEVTIRLIKGAMDFNIAEGRTLFLVDGFPRNEDNLTGWNKIMGDACDMKFVLFLDCSEKVMQERLLGRSEGRTDDNIESIRKRFSTYVESTMPIIKLYEAEGKVRKIDASPDAEAVWKVISPLFSELAAAPKKTEAIDPIKKKFNQVLRETVRRETRGDPEVGDSKPDKKLLQFWEMPADKQKELLLASVKATVFNPSTDNEDVLDVQWKVSGAFFMSISGGYHVDVTETKTDGKVLYHHCRVNSYGVMERYRTPLHPQGEQELPKQEEGSCVIA